MNILTPTDTAKLILSNAFDYERMKRKNLEEKQSPRSYDVKRFITTEKSLLKASRRHSLSRQFIEDMKASLQDMGWVMIELKRDKFIFIRMSSMDNWISLGYVARTPETGDLNKKIDTAVVSEDYDLYDEAMKSVDELASSLIDVNVHASGEYGRHTANTKV